jgi:acetylornithine deacetylase/succinyl-diaminopimelate desuccinylase-like protein
MQAACNQARAYFSDRRERILADWFDLLAIRTIGVDPLRLVDCARGAAWLRRYLKRMGFDTEVMAPAGAPPIVLAERLGRPGAPVVLFYGHYDVQPADPPDEWRSPPFEPVLVDGRVVARGAQDNKGQLFAFLQAVASLLEAGTPVPTLRIVLEGQEECGSAALLEHADSWRKRLHGDVLMVCDTGVHPSGRPAIVAGLRGIQSLTITLQGPSHDLHSGSHGGLAPNPAQGMAALLASLHDARGRIAVAGFADHVSPPSPEECAQVEAEPFDPEAYRRETGVSPEGGEQGVPPDHRVAFAPTIEINGIHSGYGGVGSKTVIPASAVAKLSMRLSPGQSPSQTLQALREHLAAHCPRGLTLTLSDVHVGTGGFRLPIHSPIFRLAADVLTSLDARGPVFRWEGASIPVVATLRQVSGAAPLLVGFGREQDRIHCANESFGLDQFEQVMTYAAGMLAALAAS